MTTIEQKAPFKTGDLVKYSGEALRSRRSAWLLAGSAPEKSRAKTELDDHAAKRGEVKSCAMGRFSWCVEVKMVCEGALHYAMPHIFELA